MPHTIYSTTPTTQYTYAGLISWWYVTPSLRRSNSSIFVAPIYYSFLLFRRICSIHTTNSSLSFQLPPYSFRIYQNRKIRGLATYFFSTNLHIIVKRLKKQKSSLQKIDFGSPFLHLESKTVGSGSDKNRSLFKTFYTNPPTV